MGLVVNQHLVDQYTQQINNKINQHIQQSFQPANSSQSQDNCINQSNQEVGQSSGLIQHASSSSQQSILNSEQLIDHMRDQLTTQESSQVQRNKKKMYFKILKVICKHRKQLISKKNYLEKVQKYKYFFNWLNALARKNRMDSNKNVVMQKHSNIIKKRYFELWTKAILNEHKIIKQLQLNSLRRKQQLLKVLAQHAEQSIAFTHQSQLSKYTKIRNRCFKLLKKKAANTKLDYQYFCQFRDQYLVHKFIQQIQIEIQANKLRQPLEQLQQPNCNLDETSNYQIKNKTNQTDQENCPQPDKGTYQIVPAQGSEFQRDVQQDQMQLDSTLQTEHNQFDHNIPQSKARKMQPNNLAADLDHTNYINQPFQFENKPEPLTIPILTSISKQVKYKFDAYLTEEQGQMSPRPVDLPTQTAINMDVEPFQFHQEQFIDQKTEESCKQPSQMSFMDQESENDQIEQVMALDTLQEDKVAIKLPLATGYFRQVKKAAILRPDLEWTQDDQSVTVDIPRMGAICCQLDDIIIQKDDVELIFIDNQDSLNNSKVDLSMSSKSLGNSLSKQTSVFEMQMVSDDEEHLIGSLDKQMQPKCPPQDIIKSSIQQPSNLVSDQIDSVAENHENIDKLSSEKQNLNKAKCDQNDSSKDEISAMPGCKDSFRSNVQQQQQIVKLAETYLKDQEQQNAINQHQIQQRDHGKWLIKQQPNSITCQLH